MKLHNTLSRTIDDIQPLEGNKIKLYTCGLTVYSQPHIGNWVAYIYWDVLVRTLKDAGYDVTHVQNITDVGHLTSDEDAGEDKMLKGALTEGLTAWQVAEKYIAIADNEAYNKLGLLRPDHMPRATEYIPQQIAFVEELEKKGFTYVIADGVYFDTSKLNNYGELARLDIKGLQFGARVANTGKKNPTDFAVWKFSDPSEKRDMEWESPWGKGFPGWHLECSVMARELLGDQIDIHTGGIDHIPVHHTNEIAQTEAVTGRQFSKYWVHANHIKVNGEKMSKSLGNIYTLQDILDKGFDLDAFKLMVLSKHYSTEGNFTWEILEAAQNRLKGFNEAIDEFRFQAEPDAALIGDNFFASTEQAIREKLQYNLDTVGALTSLNEAFDYIGNSGGGLHPRHVDEFVEFLQFVDNLFGFNLSARQDITNEQQILIKERQEARDDQNWEISDQVRDQLLAQGIQIKDTPNGQVWSRV